MLHVHASLTLRRSEIRLATMPGAKVGVGIAGRVRPVWHGRALTDVDADPTHDWPVPCDAAGLTRLRHPHRRAQWVTGRLCLQDLVLADDHLAAIRPTVTRMESGDPDEQGRPLIVNDRGDAVAQASVSHCADCSVAVLSRSPCAVDLEPRHAVAQDSVASVFSDEEARVAAHTFASLSSEDQASVYWTVIECLAKLCGRPSFGYGRFRILPRSPGDPPDTVRFASAKATGSPQVQARISVTLFPDHILSVATTDPLVDPDLWATSPTPQTPERSPHVPPCRS